MRCALEKASAAADRVATGSSELRCTWRKSNVSGVILGSPSGTAASALRRTASVVFASSASVNRVWPSSDARLLGIGTARIVATAPATSGESGFCRTRISALTHSGGNCFNPAPRIAAKTLSRVAGEIALSVAASASIFCTAAFDANCERSRSSSARSAAESVRACSRSRSQPERASPQSEWWLMIHDAVSFSSGSDEVSRPATFSGSRPPPSI